MNSTVKLFEVRDQGTFMPVMALKMHAESAPESWLMARAGYGHDPMSHLDYVLFAPIDGSVIGEINYNWSKWATHTRLQAHRFIEEHWDELKSGDVIDIEYIMGKTAEPVESEIGRSWDRFIP